MAKINHDDVLLEILVFLVPFSQAYIKSGFSDLWNVSSFQSNLKNPVLETGPCLLNFIEKNTTSIEANLPDLFVARQKEYFQQNGIDNFLANLADIFLENRIQRQYQKNENQEKLQPLLKQGLGRILADHNLALIKIVGRG